MLSFFFLCSYFFVLFFFANDGLNINNFNYVYLKKIIIIFIKIFSIFFAIFFCYFLFYFFFPQKAISIFLFFFLKIPAYINLVGDGLSLGIWMHDVLIPFLVFILKILLFVLFFFFFLIVFFLRFERDFFNLQKNLDCFIKVQWFIFIFFLIFIGFIILLHLFNYYLLVFFLWLFDLFFLPYL